MTITRRRILQAGAAFGGIQFLSMTGTGPMTDMGLMASISELDQAKPSEDLISYVERVRGAWDDDLYRKLLGAANEWKEGDAIVGVAAANQEDR